LTAGPSGLDVIQVASPRELEVNPSLLHVLKIDFSCEVDQAALADRIPDGVIDEPWELLDTYEWIRE
jgi:hypothetical protein